MDPVLLMSSGPSASGDAGRAAPRDGGASVPESALVLVCFLSFFVIFLGSSGRAAVRDGGGLTGGEAAG